MQLFGENTIYIFLTRTLKRILIKTLRCNELEKVFEQNAPCIRRYKKIKALSNSSLTWGKVLFDTY